MMMMYVSAFIFGIFLLMVGFCSVSAVRDVILQVNRSRADDDCRMTMLNLRDAYKRRRGSPGSPHI